MSPDQKQKALETANAAKNKIVTLWKSGKKGKAIIIGGAVVILGVMGQIFGGGETTTVSAGESTPAVKEKAKKEADPLEVDQSYLKNASDDTAQPNNDVVPVIKGKSIMTIARDRKHWSKEYNELADKYNGHGSYAKDGELGNPVSMRRSVESLYSTGFYSPVTHEKAKTDPSKDRFTLFGGTLKIGDEIDIPPSVASNDKALEFTIGYDRVGKEERYGEGKNVRFHVDTDIMNSWQSDDREWHWSMPDKSQVWKMEYNIKEYMGLNRAYTKWYREAGSNKLVMFWCEVKNQDAGNSKKAQETRERLKKAITGKYPAMEKTYRDKVTDEYMMNGDILEIMQSPVPEGTFSIDAPFIKVSMITPSVVVKLLKVIDEAIKQDYEAFKKKDSGALDNF